MQRQMSWAAVLLLCGCGEAQSVSEYQRQQREVEAPIAAEPREAGEDPGLDRTPPPSDPSGAQQEQATKDAGT